MIGTMDGPWLLVAGVVLLSLAMRNGARDSLPSWSLIAVLSLGAVAARAFWGIWGPLHVNGQGPLWIRGALEPAALAGYGPGYSELFGWAARFGTAADRAIFWANVILSGLSPALLYATARLTGVARGGALAASLLLAADPVTIRTAASESYFASLIALVLLVQLTLALGSRAQGQGNIWARNLAFIAAGLIAASTARIHPMSYLPLALSPLVTCGSSHTESLLSRLRRVVLAAAVIAMVVLLTSATTIMTALRASPMTDQAVSSVVPIHALLLLGLVAVVVVLHRWLTPPWLALLAVCSLGCMLATQNAFQQSPLWQLCYQRLFLAGILLGAAPLLPSRAGLLGGVVVASVASVFLFGNARAHLLTPTTEQLEYRFLQQTLRGVGPHCTLAAVNHAGIRVWEIPSYLLPETDGQRGVASPSDLASAPGDCLLYVRSSLCSSVEARTLCDSVESGTPLQRMASETFPATPSYVGLPYDEAAVTVTLFRVSGVRRGVVDGIAITPGFAQRVYERIVPLREADGCRVVRLDTSRFRMTVGLQPPNGQEQAVEIATASAPDGAVGWTVVAPESQQDCAVTVAALGRVLHALDDPLSAAAPEGK